MAKTARRIYETHPFKIIEKDFHSDSAKVSESIFCLSNEHMGVRGVFEEGTTADTLIGSYFNGIYDYAKKENRVSYKGIIKKTHFMVNSVNWLKMSIYADDEKLDLNVSTHNSFVRELDMQTGILSRSFVWELKSSKKLNIFFERFLSMTDNGAAYQSVKIKANETVALRVEFFADYDVLHWGHDNYFNHEHSDISNQKLSISGKTLTTNQRVTCAFDMECEKKHESIIKDKHVKAVYNINLKKNEEIVFKKRVYNYVQKVITENKEIAHKKARVLLEKALHYDDAKTANKKYWTAFWDKSDIQIEGDQENQQGIRFCVFQLQQTYHGASETNNIGAKGLSGEAYSGHAFWDTETYCLPYFLLNNPKAAKMLLMYRYNGLKQAKERSAMLDLKGACFPIATLNGEEGCDLWQHASLQPQPSTGVAYGIFHYEKITNDTEFLFSYGLEMLVEISRYLFSRGDYDPQGRFGFFSVMGPDEFQMMVNHNTYTNFMAKKTFLYTFEVLLRAKKMDIKSYNQVLEKTALAEEELEDFKKAADKMVILYDEKTKLFEQHMGFFDLPHVDIDSIKDEDFPLYHNWSYDRIYRNDIIKQPDVLMFMLLYNGDFTKEEISANYNYYEPRCIHESSLSPSVHSILAAQMGKVEEALDFFAFATRLDLDDYNRNASEGLHSTSIAAAWLNIVYGFGGVRTDSQLLSISPVMPSIWKSYSFGFEYMGERFKVLVSKDSFTLTKSGDKAIKIKIYGQEVTIIDKIVRSIKSIL